MDVDNVHFQDALPKERALTLMRRAEPPPAWLKEGKPSQNKMVASKDWMSTETFEALQRAADPKAAWRSKFLGHPRSVSFDSLDRERILKRRSE